MHRYVAAYEHATWRTHLCTRVHVCACLRVSVIREIKHSFQSLCYLINHLLIIYPLDFDFVSCGTIFLF